MKKTTTWMQRLLALALAFVMVLGYVPVSSAAESFGAVMMKATVTKEVTGGTSTDNPEDPEETTPLEYTYTITVKNGEGNDIEDPSLSITWDDTSTDKTRKNKEEESFSATVVYGDMKLTVTTLQETSWQITGVTWDPIQANTAIKAPKINLSEGASLDTEPDWSITDGNGQPVSVGATASLSMSTLNASTTIAGQEITATTSITAVPVAVASVTPAAGWYDALPATVTVTGTNGATLADSEKNITINGTEYSWTDADGDGNFEISFAPVAGTAYTIGENSYTWNVDAVEPTINIHSAYVNDAGDTVVVYNYTIGPSGGTVTIGNQTKSVTTNESNATVTLTGALDNVTATIKNNLTTPDTAEDTQTVTPRPGDIAYWGAINEVGGITYVAENATLTFTIGGGAYGEIKWRVNDVEVSGENGLNYVLNNVVSYAGQPLKVSAEDTYNRSKEVTLNIAVDNEAPVITITPPAGEPTDLTSPTYFNEKRTYQINITENTNVLNSCSAKAIINGQEVPVDLPINGQGTVTVTDGQTLTGITVNAADMNGKTATETYTTNVCVDTTPPEIEGEIAITYVDENGQEVAGSISSLYNQGGKIYLVLDEGANNENDAGKRDVTVTAKYTLKETNPDAATAAAWGNGTITYSETVKKDEVKTLVLTVSAKDLAGNVPTAAKINLHEHIALDGDNGVYSKTVIVDRRTPEDINNDPLTEAPKVTLAVDGDHSYTDTNGIRYFRGDFDFEMNIKDGDSGLDVEDPEADPIQNANIVVTASGANVTLNTATVRPDASGNAKVNMTITDGQEAKDGMVQLKIFDNVGNYYYYHEAFAVDSLAPRVSVALSSADTGKETVGSVDFYQNEVTLTFKLEDQLPCDATIKYAIDGVDQTPLTLKDNGAETAITIVAGQKLTALSVTAEDAIKNSTTSFSGYTFTNAIEVDGTPAVATVTISENETPVVADGVSYYSNDVTVTVSVADKNITSDGGTAKLTYAIDGVSTEIDLLKQTGYTYEFKVENNHVLTDLKLDVVDDAGNVTTTITGVDSQNMIYTGNKLAVDRTAPVVTVVKSLDKASWVQTVGTNPGTAYYKDGTVKYTVTITDAFLNKDASKITFNNGGTATFTVGEGKLSAVDTMTLEFVVNDDVVLTDIAITSVDMIGLTAAEAAVTDALATADLAFEKTENTLSYTGPDVVADTKAPVATVVLSGNIETLVEQNGVYYVQVKAPANGLGNIFTGADKEKVELTLKVQDKNLTLDKTADNTYISSNINGKAWTLDNGVATYKDSVEVDLHNTAYFKIDVAAYDLVGHPMKLEAIRLGENQGQEIEIDAEGTWKATISLDRRTPSTEDGEIPEIKLTDNAAKKNSTLDGLELYAKAFEFELNVKDQKGAEEPERHAGLKSVEWTLEDGVGAVQADNNKKPYYTYTSSHSESIAVTGAGETDSAKVTIIAVDNVNNKIQYSKNFAFDTLAPRVTVTFDGESLRDNEYYNKTRTAVVEITDLHMPALADFDNYVKIDTQGTASGWKQEGTKYTNTYTFAADGIYTFSMTAKDIAGNETDNAAVTYVGEHTDKFVIDQTNPVLRVNLTPGTPSGRDEQGVQYYAQNVTATATITELNFAAADVIARFTNTNASFGAWSDDLDHKASVTFGQGNRYSFDVSFQDLAGNKAEVYESPVFSVDMTDPTIVISRGDLKAGQMNIVPDDLTLGLTINDAQQNLSDYNVTVTHMDNNFKKTVVTGAEYYTVATEAARTTVVVNFNKIAALKTNDGVYTVNVTARDYAGNSVSLTPDVTFSLNRFGSTFTTDDEFTLNFLSTGADGNAYHKGIDKKLVIQEINPNAVWQNDQKKDEGSTITVVVNGTATELKEGKDYDQSVREEGKGNTKWYIYTYEIAPKAFESNGELVDGRYSILLYGVDDAGNKNTNEANESGKLQKNANGDYTGKIEFVLDCTAPIVTTTGIESRKNYNAEAQQMKIFLSDNTPASVRVYLNDEEVVLSEAELAQMSAWLVYDEEAGCYVLNVPEQNTLFAGQNIRIVVSDAAGNEAEYDIADFSVSTNFFVRMLNSTWFLVGGGSALLALIAYIIFILKKKLIPTGV